MARARAIATRCCWPPDSRARVLVLLVHEVDLGEEPQSQRHRIGSAHALHAQWRLDYVAQHGHVRPEIELLEHHTERGTHSCHLCGVGTGRAGRNPIGSPST
jgi:hypothetical protein